MLATCSSGWKRCLQYDKLEDLQRIVRVLAGVLPLLLPDLQASWTSTIPRSLRKIPQYNNPRWKSPGITECPQHDVFQKEQRARAMLLDHWSNQRTRSDDWNSYRAVQQGFPTQLTQLTCQSYSSIFIHLYYVLMSKLCHDGVRCQTKIMAVVQSTSRQDASGIAKTSIVSPRTLFAKDFRASHHSNSE